MKNFFWIGALIFIFSLASGCESVGARFSRFHDNRSAIGDCAYYYMPATCEDINSFIGLRGHPWAGGFAIIPLFDLPISFVTDVVLLPFDLVSFRLSNTYFHSCEMRFLHENDRQTLLTLPQPDGPYDLQVIQDLWRMRTCLVKRRSDRFVYEMETLRGPYPGDAAQVVERASLKWSPSGEWLAHTYNGIVIVFSASEMEANEPFFGKGRTSSLQLPYPPRAFSVDCRKRRYYTGDDLLPAAVLKGFEFEDSKMKVTWDVVQDRAIIVDTIYCVIDLNSKKILSTNAAFENFVVK